MLAHAYLNAQARNVTPICVERRRLGLGLELESGQVIRVAITAQCAAGLVSALADYVKSAAGSQSPMSELIASDPRSTPSEGVKV